MTFDDGLLDDEVALARADVRLRYLAEGGARVRREAVAAQDAVAEAVQRLSDGQPRAVVAAGPDSRLLRAVLEPVCPVPFVAWPGPGPPRAGPAASTSSWCWRPRGATRPRPARSPRPYAAAARWSSPRPRSPWSPSHAQGRYATMLPTQTGDQLAVAVVVLDLLDRVHLGPQTDPNVIADALDEVAVTLRPAPRHRGEPGQDPGHRHRRLQPAASGAAPCWPPAPAAGSPSRCAGPPAGPPSPRTPSTCCPSSRRRPRPTCSPTRSPTVASSAGRRWCSSTTGRPTLPCSRPATGSRRPPRRTGVRVETISSEADGDVARYAAMLSTGMYAAAYLQLGLDA